MAASIDDDGTKAGFVGSSYYGGAGQVLRMAFETGCVEYYWTRVIESPIQIRLFVMTVKGRENVNGYGIIQHFITIIVITFLLFVDTITNSKMHTLIRQRINLHMPIILKHEWYELNVPITKQ
eukprot:scaffold21553_cov22-Cyclotella_meneghiniana.AAC.1